MECRDCNKNMLSSPDSTVVWTGDDFPELGIEKGTSLNTVVNKLIQALKSTSNTQKSNVSADDIKINGNNLSLTGKITPCASKIVNRDFYYEVNSDASGITFSYNLNDILNNLPKETVGAYGTDVSIIGTAAYGPINILMSNKAINGIYIPLDKFPIIVNFKVYLNSTCGSIELIKRVTIDSSNAKGKFYTSLDLNESGSTKDSYTQTELNQMMISQVNELSRKIDNITQTIK